MRALGAALGRAAESGDCLLLEGEFGAGKTTLVQGLAEGLEVPDAVSSPSFVLEHQHYGRLPLYHIDLYRLEHLDADFLQEMEEHLFGDGVAAVEWPALLPTALRRGATGIQLSVEGAELRRVVIRTDLPRLRAAARAALGGC